MWSSKYWEMIIGRRHLLALHNFERKCSQLRWNGGCSNIYSFARLALECLEKIWSYGWCNNMCAIDILQLQWWQDFCSNISCVGGWMNSSNEGGVLLSLCFHAYGRYHGGGHTRGEFLGSVKISLEHCRQVEVNPEKNKGIQLKMEPTRTTFSMLSRFWKKKEKKMFIY